MSNKGLMIIADYSSHTSLSLEEFCDICHVTSALLDDFVAYAIIHPPGESRAEWRFNLHELRRVQKALRLQRDLGINLAGAALVLDLLDELNEVRERLEVIEKHYT